MSDRAANEKKVTKLIKEKRESDLMERLNLGIITEEERHKQSEFFSFTCAAHKINNMAIAMTASGCKYLYGMNSGVRGMQGAKKHIYECNKLLCENARKEYGLGNEFRAYSLCSESDTGSHLFKPIIGNRYLIFLQNAIPTLAARDAVLLFLEDVKDAKEIPGLNNLELSVQTGYLSEIVQVEEAAFAILYFHVCAPLLTKAKSSDSPLQMNFYYECAINKLNTWSSDPSSLISGQQLMWEGAKGPSVYETYIQGIRDKYCTNKLLCLLLKEMVAAGKEKLRSHAEEHLSGGIYSSPSDHAIQAANTIGDATNDVIESTFGMLDRQMMIAPSSNPVNVSSLIAAKRDKPVSWVLENDLDKDKVCCIAMKSAQRKRKLFGTKDCQTKTRYQSIQPERLAKIKKT